MTILNIDDDLEDQEIFTEAIDIIDPLFTCIKANNGLEGHELLFHDEKQLSIDYIFLDINMPKMNGIELLSLIKKNDRLRNIPVYVLSTSCSQRERAEINLLGAIMLEKQSQFEMNIKMLRSIIKPETVVH
jgi:CheY-like chemotaxis protein